MHCKLARAYLCSSGPPLQPSSLWFKYLITGNLCAQDTDMLGEYGACWFPFDVILASFCFLEDSGMVVLFLGPVAVGQLLCLLVK